MEALILLGLVFFALCFRRRRYVVQPPVTVNVIVDGRSLTLDSHEGSHDTPISRERIAIRK